MSLPPLNMIASENTAKSVPQYKVLKITPQPNKNEFWIGRNPEADLSIMDITVSRKHACLRYADDHWSILDNKSSNGVRVNDVKIPIAEYIILKHNDKISIENGALNYEWLISIANEEPCKSLSESILIEKEKIAETHKKSVIKVKEEKNMIEKKAIEIEKEKLDLISQKDHLQKIMSEERKSFANKQAEQYSKFKAQLKYAKEEVIKSEKAKFDLKLQEEKKIAEKQMAEKEKCLLESLKEAENRLQSLVNEKDAIVISLEFEMEKNREEMAQRKKEFDSHVKQLYKDCEKEKTTRQQHRLEIEDLKRNFDDVLHQSEKENEETIRLLKSDAVKEREEKESLKSELKERDEELAKLKEVLKVRQNSEESLMFLSKCNEELKCSICDELFIEPMSLGCGHVYCCHCLKQWEVNCGNCFASFNCPNCREPVKSFTKSLQIENLISSVFKNLSTSIQEEREKLIKERKAEETAAKEKQEAAKRQKEKEMRERNHRRRRERRGRNNDPSPFGPNVANRMRDALGAGLTDHQRNQRGANFERRRNLQELVRNMRARMPSNELQNSPQPVSSPNTRSRVRNTVNSIRQRLITEMTTRVTPNDDVQVISNLNRREVGNTNQRTTRSTVANPPLIDLEGESETENLDSSGDTNPTIIVDDHNIESNNESIRSRPRTPSQSSHSSRTRLRSASISSTTSFQSSLIDLEAENETENFNSSGISDTHPPTIVDDHNIESSNESIRSRSRTRSPSSHLSRTRSRSASRSSTTSSQSSSPSEDTNSNSSGSQEHSDSSVEGIEGFYYGGYGECYNCGRRGHWAPGCPY